jgi:hypothetical protein
MGTRRCTTAPDGAWNAKSCMPGSTDTARPSRRDVKSSPSTVTCTSKIGSPASSFASSTIDGISASI